MSGQYPGGYSPHGGHRGQFNPQQQQQMMNQMGPGPMDVGPQVGGAGGGAMMPMGGYSGGAGSSGIIPQQQQQAMGMGMQSPSHMQQQQMMPMQQQMQMQHQQQMGGGGSGMQHMGNMMGPTGQGGMIPNPSIHMQQQQQQQHVNPNMQQAQIQQQVANNPSHAMSQQQQQQHHHQQNAPTPQLQQPASSSMLTMSHPTPPKEINIVQLSRLGQETVQDITSRFQEVFSALKIIQPTQNRDNNTEKKVQENFRTIRLLFKRVRIIYEKCNDGYPQGMEYAHVESLIPMKDEPELRIDGIHCDEYRKVLQENQELIETVKLKNRQLREIIDRTRLIIWEINTMLAMRRS